MTTSPARPSDSHARSRSEDASALSRLARRAARLPPMAAPHQPPILELVRITEAAAIACAHYLGHGDNTKADQAAVDAMRKSMNDIEFSGRIVIGEGERDEAPMLFIGE